MELTVNGDDRQVPDGVNLRELLTELGLPDTGVAVAVDGMVVPCGRWDEAVQPYAKIDVVTAVQGG